MHAGLTRSRRPSRTRTASAAAALLLAAGLYAGAGAAAEFVLPPPGYDVVGTVRHVKVQEGDTLADVARNENVGHQQIRAANPKLDFWLPEVGATVTIPSQHILPPGKQTGIVLNLPEMRIYWYPPVSRRGETPRVVTYPVSIGRMDWSTPLGETYVSARVTDPTWTPTESLHAEALSDGRTLPTSVPPGPDNPLGKYALRLGLPSYLIHGTNRPYGIGMRVTHGCIRMYPEDIEVLFPQVKVGTRVEIMAETVKVGWSSDLLFIEVHQPLEEHDLGAVWLRDTALARVEAAAANRPVKVSGRDVLRAIEEKSGIPVLISVPESL